MKNYCLLYSFYNLYAVLDNLKVFKRTGVDWGVANKNMLSDTEAYFFTNGRTSKENLKGI